jgi:hypothetical protein
MEIKHIEEFISVSKFNDYSILQITDQLREEFLTQVPWTVPEEVLDLYKHVLNVRFLRSRSSLYDQYDVILVFGLKQDGQIGHLFFTVVGDHSDVWWKQICAPRLGIYDRGHSEGSEKPSDE